MTLPLAHRLRLLPLSIFALVSIAGWQHPEALAASKPPPPIKKVIISGSSQIRLHKIGAIILKNVYTKAGIDFRWERLPTRRSLVLANAGVYDGEIARIPGVSSRYRNLIAVPTPIMNMSAHVYTISTNRNIQSWRDLKGLHIAVVRGELFAETGTKNLKRTFVNNYWQLFQMLVKGRADVAIGIDADAAIERTKNFPDKGIHIIGRSIFETPLYHLIHKKNARLIPRLNRVIRTMSDDGSLAKITREAIKAMMANTTQP